MHCFRFLICLLFILMSVTGASAQWMAEKRLGRVAHLVNAQAKVIRYDLDMREYLATIELPQNHGELAAAEIDEDGIYAAYGNSVYRYALDGTDERHVTDVQNPISSIFTDGDLLLIVHPVQHHARVTSVRKDTHAFIDFHEVYPAGNYAACISPGQNRIVGSSIGLSPAKHTSISYGDDGVFTGDDSGGPPHPQIAGSKSWVDEEFGRVIDNLGNIFGLEAMDYIGRLEREPTSVTSVPGGLVVGARRVLTLHDADLKVLGDVTPPSGLSTDMVMDGGDLLVPSTYATWTRYSLADFQRVPVASVEPARLAYTIDDAFASTSGIVYLFSKARSSLFLWDPGTLAYAGVIPLRKDVMAVTYSAATDTIYTGYPSGVVRCVRLSVPDPSEEIFTLVTHEAGRIAAAGDQLFFASGPTSITFPQTYTHYVFAADGSVVSRRPNQFATFALSWNPATKRMYYQSRDGNDTKLGWFLIDGTSAFTGHTVVLDTRSYYDSTLQAVRPSPTGSIVASTESFLKDGTTLSTLSDHQYTQGRFKDAAWTDGGFYTIHEVWDVSSTQNVTLVLRSDGTTLASLGSRRIHGLPSLIRPLSGGRLLLATVPVGGVPSLRVLDADLQVAHGGTLAPPPVISVENYSYYSRLKWGDVPAAASFTVQRRQIPDGPWTTIGTGISGYDDSQLQGRTYEYRVLSANGGLLSEPAYFNQPSLAGE
jgi:hypothetical protein